MPIKAHNYKLPASARLSFSPVPLRLSLLRALAAIFWSLCGPALRGSAETPNLILKKH